MIVVGRAGGKTERAAGKTERAAEAVVCSRLPGAPPVGGAARSGVQWRVLAAAGICLGEQISSGERR